MKALQFKHQAFLRSFVIYNAILTYVFTGSAWKAFPFLLAAEILYFCALLVYNSNYSGNSSMKRNTLAEGVLTFVMSAAYLVVYIVYEYTLDAASFIGEMRYIILSGALLSVCAVRVFLLFMSSNRLLTIVVGICFVPFAIIFTWMLADEGFWVDSHTVTVAVSFAVIAFFFATVGALVISYYTFIVHGVILAVILIFLRDKHSDISFGTYINGI